MEKINDQKKANKFNTWLNNKFIPYVGKIGNQTHLSIIRDSFALITPLLIAGALAVFINQIILGNSIISLAYWVAKWSNSFESIDARSVVFLPSAAKGLATVASINGVIWNASLMSMTLYIVFIIGYLLGKRRGQDPAIMAGIVSFATFIVAGAGIAGWEFAQKFMGAEGLFSGIIIAFLSAELFIFLQPNNRLAIKMPKNVPPAVGHAFAKLLPMIITIFGFGAISQILIWAPIEYTIIEQFSKTFRENPDFLGIYRDTNGNFFQLLNNNTLQPLTNSEVSIITKLEYLTISSDAMWGQFGVINSSLTGEYSALNLNFKALTLVTLIYKFFTYPFMTVAQNPNIGLGIALLYIFFVSMFWFFGLHETNIMNGIFAPVWLYATAQNTIAFDQDQPLSYLFSQGFFDGFIFLGGWGMSLGLLLITLLVGRDKQARTIAKTSVAPGIFNINEPVTFAYPLILNPVMAIPAIIRPCLIVIWTWVWMITGVVPRAALLIPWVAPVGIGAYITTGSYKGILLALVNLILMAILYLPFILIANKIAKNNNTAVPIAYLGRLQFLLTGRNYGEIESKELREKQRNELKEVNDLVTRQKLKKQHQLQWKELQLLLKNRYKQTRLDKKTAKQIMKKKNNKKEMEK